MCCDDDLQMLYCCGRRELEAAYLAQPRDAALIERIAEDLLQLERSLFARQGRIRPAARTAGRMQRPMA